MRVEAVVVGYDGSADSCAALDAALDQVSGGGLVHVVTVVDDHTLAEIDRLVLDTPPGLPPAPRQCPESMLRRWLRDATLLAAARGVRHAGHLLVADHGAGDCLLEVAARTGADLVAVGCHGVGRERCSPRGGVATQIARRAPTSVLLVHHHDSDVPAVQWPERTP